MIPPAMYIFARLGGIANLAKNAVMMNKHTTAMKSIVFIVL